MANQLTDQELNILEDDVRHIPLEHLDEKQRMQIIQLIEAERERMVPPRIYMTAEWKIAASKVLLALVQEARPDVTEVDLNPIIQMASAKANCRVDFGTRSG